MARFLLVVALGLIPAGMFATTGIAPKRLGRIDCRITGAEPVIRAEGLTEVAGPVTLTCTNEDVPDSGAFTGYFNADVTARVGSINETAANPVFEEGRVNVTNRISFGLGTNISDAVLVVGGNDAPNAKATSVLVTGTDPRFPIPHAGLYTGSNVLLWDDVQLPVPGAPNEPDTPPVECTSFDAGDATGCHPTTIVFVIKNVRVNGLFDNPDTLSVEKIAMRVSIVGSPAARVLDSLGGDGSMADVVKIADPEKGVTTTFLGSMAEGEVCVGETRPITVTMTEGYASAFKLLGEAAFVQSDASGESGYPVRNDADVPLSGVNGGGADGPTRFILRFTGVPTGVSVSVAGEVNNGSAAVDGDGLWVRRLAGAGPDGSGGTPVTTPAFVGFTAGFGSTTYELLDANVGAIESISIPVTITWASGAPVAASIIGIEGTLAPASADNTADPAARIPRFTNVAQAREQFTLQACPSSSECFFSNLGADEAYFDVTGGAINFGVVASHPSCIWSTEQGDFTIADVGFARLGTDTIRYTISANTTGDVRTDEFTQAGLPRKVVQRATTRLFDDAGPELNFFDPINRVRVRGITDGCAALPLRYCPKDVITRGQMAVFIIRAIFGGDDFTFPTDPVFDDVPLSHPFFRWIQKMDELGITSGCTAANYCPGDPVTRGQMAVFIIRMRFGATVDFGFPAIPVFDDVSAGHIFYKWIQKLAEIGITSGCSASNYCPDDPVLRDQMAVFILRGGFNEFLGTPFNITLVSTLAPSTGLPGTTVSVRLESEALFPAGVPTVTAVPGITPGAVLLPEENVIEIDLVIAVDADPGQRSLNLMFPGGTEITFPNAFTIADPGP